METWELLILNCSLHFCVSIIMSILMQIKVFFCYESHILYENETLVLVLKQVIALYYNCWYPSSWLDNLVKFSFLQLQLPVIRYRLFLGSMITWKAWEDSYALEHDYAVDEWYSFEDEKITWLGRVLYFCRSPMASSCFHCLRRAARFSVSLFNTSQLDFLSPRYSLLLYALIFKRHHSLISLFSNLFLFLPGWLRIILEPFGEFADHCVFHTHQNPV